jgi:hypothetical protein
VDGFFKFPFGKYVSKSFRRGISAALILCDEELNIKQICSISMGLMGRSMARNILKFGYSVIEELSGKELSIPVKYLPY